MKKLILSLGSFLLLLGVSLSAVAAISVSHVSFGYNGEPPAHPQMPEFPFDKPFVGKIIAAESSTSNGKPAIIIETMDIENPDAEAIPGLAISFTDEDLSFGIAAASSIGKSVFVMFDSKTKPIYPKINFFNLFDYDQNDKTALNKKISELSSRK